jgi:hypothetical protein
VTKDHSRLPRLPELALPEQLKKHLGLSPAQREFFRRIGRQARPFSSEAREAREILQGLRQETTREATLREEIAALRRELADREAALRKETVGREETLRVVEAWAEREFSIPPARPAPAAPPVDPPPVAAPVDPTPVAASVDPTPDAPPDPPPAAAPPPIADPPPADPLVTAPGEPPVAAPVAPPVAAPVDPPPVIAAPDPPPPIAAPADPAKEAQAGSQAEDQRQGNSTKRDHARRALRALWPNGPPPPGAVKATLAKINGWLQQDARERRIPLPPKIERDTLLRALERRK